MKKWFGKFSVLFGIGCMAVVLFVVVLIFLSERFTGAGNYTVNSTVYGVGSSANTEIYAKSLEKLRSEYSNIKTVEMEATVAIDVIKPDSVVSGTGQVAFIAQDNRYKYVCSVSENLEKEGLMRNVDILYNGNKFYFFDHESKIVSFQDREEVRIPSALPNPFFLPIEFLSNDDDSCEGCKMRLQDTKMPVRWADRVSAISEISREADSEAFHGLIKMPGGTMNQMPYNYQVRLVGESADTLQPVSIARVKENGTPFVEVLLQDLRPAEGVGVNIPHTVQVGARDETGKMVLKAVFTITKLKINQTFGDASFSPNFAGAVNYWDSDAKSFVNY
jgi:hypothetical protein